MTMLTIYGPARSSAGRCLWCAEEAQVPYENKPVNLMGKEHKSETFLKINPNGKVPAMVDGDVTLFESMAINFYIAEKYKPELLGLSIKDKALTYQWSFWASSELQDPIIQVFIQKVFMPPEKKSEAVINDNMEKLPKLFEILNQSLFGKKYLNGNAFTLADLHVASVASISEHIGFDLKPYAHVGEWLRAISDRPAFQKYQALRRS